MMSLSTYLTFDGNCREAFEFYRSVFGTEFVVLTTFAEAPEDMDVPNAHRDKVMHVTLPIGSSVLMGSDNDPSGSPVVVGNNFSISVDTEGRQESDDLIGKLSAGGTVTMPMQETFWGSYFGMCTDRFGINWMVSCHLSA
ncbi:MAG: VOC family protein [Gammaproteobacteria bacterium]|nr:VOC family protein [Gammaproteobacteria bacterium]MXY54930.1 VOC family protein [Gammaproteobacteria bacterium]MYF28023.1 VOC family protein [Gammaproteobacteria bacterium]MYK47196.1 VOC family protein [Gammaproteobacteria bacterium]